jgi:hypothetical protein
MRPGGVIDGRSKWTRKKEKLTNKLTDITKKIKHVVRHKDATTDGTMRVEQPMGGYRVRGSDRRTFGRSGRSKEDSRRAMNTHICRSSRQGVGKYPKKTNEQSPPVIDHVNESMSPSSVH